jgi:putative Holliday junction resolvase
MRIFGVDPGDKRIGVAVSDLSGTIANPLGVINHVSRPIDAAVIASMAKEQNAGIIVVGQALDENNEVGPAARKSLRMAEAIRSQCSISVVLWDESGSTQAAQQAGIALGVSRHKRQGHLDHLAATVILQSYLDAQNHTSN